MDVLWLQECQVVHKHLDSDSVTQNFSPTLLQLILVSIAQKTLWHFSPWKFPLKSCLCLTRIKVNCDMQACKFCPESWSFRTFLNISQSNNYCIILQSVNTFKWCHLKQCFITHLSTIALFHKANYRSSLRQS